MDIELMKTLLELWNKWKQEARKSGNPQKLIFTRQAQIFWLNGVETGFKLAKSANQPEKSA